MADDWLLWQLADSAFPAGAFAHSGGLEAAWQQNRIQDTPSLVRFIETSLFQVASIALPFAAAVFREPESFADYDRLCDVQATNHVANRASRAQGMAFLAAAERIFADQRLSEFRSNLRIEGRAAHFAPVFGLACQVLNLTLDQMARLFMFWSLRGFISSAVRLGIVGPLEGQAIQLQLTDHAAKMAAQGAEILPQAASQYAPLLELLASNQDRLYSRLFQS